MNNNKKAQNYVIYSGIVVMLSIIVLLIFINKGTFSNGTSNDHIIISCPERVAIGKNFDCTVSTDISSFDIIALNATYNLSENVDLVSFKSNIECDDNSCISADHNNKFAVGSLDGINNQTVGTLTLKIPSKSSNPYTIGLTEIEGTDRNDGTNFETVELEDSSTTVELLSDVNTLSFLSIYGVTFNETFNSETTSYTATAPSNISKININAIPTDNNATITGNESDIDIHYGTNQLVITVTSESGIDKEYTISLYRNYTFTTDYYTYNQESNYIYTKNDTSSATITSHLNMLLHRYYLSVM